MVIDFTKAADLINEAFSNITDDGMLESMINGGYGDEGNDDAWDAEHIANWIGADWGSAGASKMVFHFESMPNIVFKVPFERYYSDGRDYLYNYCAREASISRMIEDAGCAELICRTWYLGVFHNLEVYVSECSETDFYEGEDNYKFSNSRDYTSREVEKLRSTNSAAYNGYKPAWEMFVDAWGVEKFSNLMAVLDEKEVNDFHCGNINFRGGKPVLIDYSGFYEGCSHGYYSSSCCSTEVEDEEEEYTGSYELDDACREQESREEHKNSTSWLEWEATDWGKSEPKRSCSVKVDGISLHLKHSGKAYVEINALRDDLQKALDALQKWQEVLNALRKRG